MGSVEDSAQELLSYRSKDEARYKYRVGDLVYSLWKGQLWKAVILETSLRMHPNGWHPIYYVGYVTSHKAGNGSYYFNKSHNEWKSEALIFEIDKDTRRRSVETQRMLRSAIKEGGLTTVEEILGRLCSQQEMKISILSYNKVEDEWFDFSETVYTVLVHDKDQISRGRLVVLPKSPSVECIFEEYIVHLNSLEKRKIFPEIEVQEEVLGMLAELFNKTLKKRLIYPPEMHQVGCFEKDVIFSKVFGIEHLLRLLVILPKLLGDYNISFGGCSFSQDIDEERDDLDYLVIKSIKLDLIKTVNSFIDYFNGSFQKLSIGMYHSFSKL